MKTNAPGPHWRGESSSCNLQYENHRLLPFSKNLQTKNLIPYCRCGQHQWLRCIANVPLPHHKIHLNASKLLRGYCYRLSTSQKQSLLMATYSALLHVKTVQPSLQSKYWLHWTAAQKRIP